MRMRNKPWAMDFLSHHAEIVDIDNKYAMRVEAFFSHKAPIHLEIGTGMGTFITTLAERYPNINFVGIELDKNILIRVVEKVIEKDLKNVRLILGDASKLDEYFKLGELNKIYLNFSDPWPKNRHEKRRLTYQSFLKIYKNILNSSGELEFKTDNRGLFEYSLISFNQFGMNFLSLDLDVHDNEDEFNIRTEYEEKFSQKGNKIYFIRASF